MPAGRLRGLSPRRLLEAAETIGGMHERARSTGARHTFLGTPASRSHTCRSRGGRNRDGREDFRWRLRAHAPHPLCELLLRNQLFGDQVGIVVRVRADQILDGASKVSVVLEYPNVLAATSCALAVTAGGSAAGVTGGCCDRA